MYEKYLPIGSIVLLKNATKKVMITGFLIKNPEQQNKIYDYIGCLYPEGVLNTEKNLLFNHDQIQTIFAIGYSDEEEINFKAKLKEELAKKNEV